MPSPAEDERIGGDILFGDVELTKLASLIIIKRIMVIFTRNRN